MANWKDRQTGRQAGGPAGSWLLTVTSINWIYPRIYNNRVH
jgi:hypothetical protein